MTKEERLSLFQEEIDLIPSSTFRELVSTLLASAPDVFFHAPASSTGKYHPSYSLGEGGLVRHVKAAVRIGKSLLDAGVYRVYDPDFSCDPDSFKTVVISALILHDLYKFGLDADQFIPGVTHTEHSHPLIAGREILQTANAMTANGRMSRDEYMLAHFVKEAVECHSGKFTYSPHSPIILPEPYFWHGWLVHICDYLASRKFIEVKQLEGDTNE